ncbi:MAG: hypothetical protein Q8S21_06210 [Candidatus Paracaedibacteraceae bacterium]|nr:hypothetical protein [Candidatus Paracaedibacteraceae bacterium]
MFFRSKIFYFLACFVVVAHSNSLLYASTSPVDLESGVKLPGLVNPSPANSSLANQQLLSPSPVSPQITGIELAIRQTDIETGGEQNEESKENLPTINDEVDSEFATSGLESYTGCSFCCWNCLYASLEDFEVGAHGISTILAASAEFMPENWKMQFVVYSIQALMLANLCQKMYSLSEKMVAIKGKRKIELKRRNKINKEDAENDEENDESKQRPILINGIDASKNTTIYATEFLANCLSCCAVARNILWDQIAVWSILCQCISGSILNFSQAVDSPSLRSNYILIGTLFGVAGTSLHTYAKLLKRKTKDAETLAINASKAVRYKKRMRKLESK